MTVTHDLQVEVLRTEDDEYLLTFKRNGSPCGALGPIAVEATANLLAEGIRWGLQLAFEKAKKR